MQTDFDPVPEAARDRAPRPTGQGQPEQGPKAAGVTAQVRSGEGWAVHGAVLTVTDMVGHQVTRTDGDDDGHLATPPLSAGSYTAIVMAPGFSPAARTAIVTADGSAALGAITLDRSSDIPLPPPGRWTIDPVHTSVTIVARHLGVASIRVRMNRFAGAIDITEPVERSTVHARLEAASLDTGNAVRDEQLRSAEFLDVENHPFIDYTGSGVTQRADDRWRVEGELTLHGITRAVPLELAYQGTTPDPWGETRAAFRALTTLHRDLFGIRWNDALLSGVPQIGLELQVELEIQAVQGDLPEMIRSILG